MASWQKPSDRRKRSGDTVDPVYCSGLVVRLLWVGEGCLRDHVEVDGADTIAFG
jgi:hypothetical protein